MTGGPLLALTAAVLAACVSLVVAVVVVKARRTLLGRRDAALLADLRPILIEVAADEDDSGQGRSALAAVTGAARPALDRSIVAMLTKIRGLPAESLVDVLEAHGAVAAAERDLGARSPIRRAHAAQLLGLARSDEAVPSLVEALHDPAGEVRTSAAYALGLIGDPTAAGPLLAALGSDGGVPASTAADALQAMGMGIADALVDGLSNADPRVRTVAAHVSGWGSFVRSVPPMRALLASDPDLVVREACAVALGRAGRAEDVGVLARHLAPSEPLSLRRMCALALRDLGDPAAVPALEALLVDRDPRLAEHAAAALLELGPWGRTALEGHSGPAIETARLVAMLQHGVLV
ncbi:MAG TPA: HEAT repeat domain-containing protein [Intrasporangium sp.]|uniref:HEAT repeat domain-containing protein n=1 Tax=Intrasporangium sp. TaxID=1925024 RepID=UPI002D76ABC0|nr:HEAT repeat domain-containing protein [Intrasporangium sp.]HET7399547.1 HEAT repeat domain-containing protein [Intrasporangium sp.]